MNLGVKHLPFISSSASWKSGDGVSDKFPAGLRVLVVDDDPTCLRILEKMLKNCLYEVTTSNRAEIALEFLRDNKNGYDIVISDVHMPDMDGFKLLERVGLEMDLPVIMMSADDSKNVVMKGVTHGACDYLIKPVRMEALKNIWQHVVRKKKHEWKDKDFEQSGSGDEQHLKPTDDADYSSSANEGNWKSSKKRKEEEDEAEEREDTSTLKKPRVVWSVELHQQFVTAVNQLGIDKAVPKKILELMNVPGLTRENVASHLQKYRLYLRRLSGVSPHQNGLGNSFMGAADAPFVSMSSLSSVDLQALAASGQLPLQSLATIQAAALGQATPKPTIPLPLVNQRNIFGYENQKSSSKQANSLLHGAPTNMDSKQLATVHQSGLGSLNISQSHSLLQMVQPQSMAQSSNDVSGSHLANIPSSLGQPVVGQNGIDNVHGPPCITISPVNAEMKVPRGFVPSYDVFNDLNQNSTPDWRLQNVGSTLERLQQSKVHGGLDASPSVSIQNRLSANGQTLAPSVNKAAFSLAEGLGNLPSINQHLNSSFCDNPVRIKSERFPDTGFHSSLFPQRFGQEDLMSAILKQLQEGTGSVENEFGYDGYPMDNLPV